MIERLLEQLQTSRGLELTVKIRVKVDEAGIVSIRGITLDAPARRARRSRPAEIPPETPSTPVGAPRPGRRRAFLAAEAAESQEAEAARVEGPIPQPTRTRRRR